MKSRQLIVASAILLSGLLTAQPVWGWGAGGHMIVAQIAYDRLNARAKGEVDRLIQIKIAPAQITSQSLDFVNAAHWPDDLRTEPFKTQFASSFPLHFADFPFNPDGTKPKGQMPAKDNVITALQRYVEVLKTSTNDNDRAQALRFVIHFVGDAQQPLHCSTLVSKGHSGGDQGGNEFIIKLVDSKGKKTNEKLHSYWDGGIGDFPKMGADFAPPPLAEIPPVAKRVMQEFPDTPAAWSTGGPSDFEGWAKESSQLAQKVAYTGVKPNQQPSTAYNATGVKTARERVAWGGYRLAALLNSIWP